MLYINDQANVEQVAKVFVFSFYLDFGNVVGSVLREGGNTLVTFRRL